jgi:hypothetical protein
MRQISKRSTSQEVADLIQSIFAAELVFPSDRLWIVSPWLSDIPVIDNRDNSFLHLEPSWGQTQIRLAEILLRLASLGTRVVVACRPVDHNRAFVQRMQEASERALGRLRICQSENLHEKGILGDGYHLSGSMNFTYSGVAVNEEILHLITDPGHVSEKKVALIKRWGK